MRTAASLSLFAGLAFGLPLAASAHEDFSCEHGKLEALGSLSAFNSETGEDVRNFAPERTVDIQHMKLELFIADMNRPQLTGKQTLRVVPFSETTTMTLDAKAMGISKVEVAGVETTFVYENNKLTLTFNPPLPAEQAVEIVTSYTLNDPPRGLIWTPESPAWAGRPAQLHTQGQPQTNSYWFPAHDFPNERLTTEILATVPAGFLVSANGRLASQERVIRRVTSATGPRLQPYETFHWLISHRLNATRRTSRPCRCPCMCRRAARLMSPAPIATRGR
jgi:aminopeptidase N